MLSEFSAGRCTCVQSLELLQLPCLCTERKPQRRGTRALAVPWSHQMQTQKNIARRQQNTHIKIYKFCPRNQIRLKYHFDTTLPTISEWKRTNVYLCQLKSPIRQQRRHPIGTFGQVTVKLRWRFDSILRRVFMDVLNSTLRNKRYWWACCPTRIRNLSTSQIENRMGAIPS